MHILHRQALSPPEPASGVVSCVALSPDATRLAYAVLGGDAPGVYLAERGAPEGRRLSAAAGWTPIDIGWSPSGAHLAYQTARTQSRAPEVAWVAAQGEGELGRIEAMAFCWLPSGKGLVISDAEESQLQRIDVATGAVRPLTNLFFDATPAHWPRVAASPDGRHVAFTGRSEEEDTSRVWFLTRAGDALQAEQLTWLYGCRAQVMPFWSPKGKTMGLHVVHEAQRRTATVLVKHLEGDGEVVYLHDDVDPAITPAWAPDGRRLALYKRGREGRVALALLDLEGEGERTLLDDAPLGKLRFADERTLVVDGGPRATLMTLSGGDA